VGAGFGAWFLAAAYRYLFGPQDAGLLTGDSASAGCVWVGSILGAVGVVGLVAGTVTRSRYLADLHDLLHGEQLERFDSPARADGEPFDSAESACDPGREKLVVRGSSPPALF
jgi:hypothetical protein